MNVLLIVSCVLLLWIGLRLCEPYSPAWVFVLMWTLQLIFAGLILDHFIAFSYTGLIYILILILSFLIGSIILPPMHGCKYPKKILAFTRVKIFLIVLFLLALGNPLVVIIQNGFSFSALFSPESLLEMGNELSGSRYSETQEVSFLSQVLLVFLYLSPLYGGYCFSLSKKKMRYLCILSILPSVIGALTQGVKMGVMTSCFLFLIGLNVFSISNGIHFVINKKKVLYSICGTIALLSFLYLVMMFRIGQIDEEAVGMVNQKVASYTVGHLPCFDTWFSKREPEDLHFGMRTFFAISNALGIEKRETGIYQERVDFGKDGFEGESNVYTAFRPLTEDFGTIGGVIFIFCMGYLSRLCIYYVKRYDKAFFCETLLCSFYAYVLWSYVTSFYSYFSYIVAFGFFYILLHFTYTNDSVPS